MFALMAERPKLVIGQVRRQQMLGSQAIYEVCDVTAELVVVAVIEAPGLARGQTVRLTHEAVDAMDVVEGDPTPKPEP